MADFQKSNWTRTASSEHARVYLPASQGFGITAATVTSASTMIYTATVPYQFQGNGQVEASLPAGATLVAGVTLGNAVLLSPASGSYALGNHPRVQINASYSSGVATTTVAVTSVVVVQY